MASTLILLYRQGDESWHERNIDEEEIVVGRGQDCDLQIDDEKISRRHFKLNRRGDAVWITDLGSSNGTKINGVRIDPNVETPLQVGQFMEIGNAVFHLQAFPEHQIEPAAAPQQIPVQTPLEQVSPQEQGTTSNFILKYRRLNEPWSEIRLALGELVIGRYAGADLYLEGETISRRHARLTIGLDAVFVQDLGSTNGTQVDNKPLLPRRQSIVDPDQVITIGNHTLQIQEAKVAERHPATVLGNLGQVITPAEKLEVYGSRFDLRPLDFNQLERVSIGRSGDNDVVLDHPLVSRYHALIEKMGTRFRLRDLESTNGVFVNGVRIQNESWLTDGDTITVGGSDFVLSGSNLQRQAELGLKLDAYNINQYVSKELNLLKDISLSIKPMEFVALVGMSGAGKTTFLNAISGYWPASDGRVLINGVSLYEYYDLFRNDIGYVPQKDIVHTELTPATALDFIARLRLPADTARAERVALIDEVLEHLDLTERRDVPISNLSGGQLKRVSIGVELLTKPRLFFLDEPTSGLDPGTEYEMMKLLRRLADQGRTVMLVTHATKNVMLCDKVIFLARGGHLAFYGPPEKALEYFDQYRTTREQREKAMEFDDIYIVLNDEGRGSPAEWGQRYLQSDVHRQLVLEQQADRMAFGTSEVQPPPPQKGKSRVSSLRQFLILSARNLKILTQDKVSLALMLALAPAIGLMDFIWGADLFDPVNGDATKIITMWFMAALITVLVGAISSVREIVKEIDIYKRERAVNLKIAPYVFSKVWVGVVLALYQAGMLLFFKFLFVRPDVPSSASYLALYLTLFIGTLCGYFIGLAISAAAPNQNAAMMLIIIVLVPQFLFAGALLPLDLIPGGEAISVFMPTRWAFESFLRISGIGDQLAEDSCWAMDGEERGNLTSEMKVGCPCMGASIFSDCTEFPGILSTDYYDEAAQMALAAPRPEEPPMPTPHPSLTPLPTPTRLPSPTPHPTPEDPRVMGAYMDLQKEQGEQYQDQIMEQMEVYRVDSEDQGQIYSDMRTGQGDEYQDLMRTYGDERSEWQENREKAISSAEGILETIYDNYGRAFSGSVIGRWLITTGLMFVFLGVVLVFQKRKDVV